MKISKKNICAEPFPTTTIFRYLQKPIITYALFFDGDYVTNEQMNDKRFLKLLKKQKDILPNEI